MRKIKDGDIHGKLALAVFAGALIFTTSALQAQDKQTQDTFEWVPAAARNEDQEVDPNARRLEVVITPTPKATADMTAFTREYVIDLAKFNISNDGKNPVKTSRGINAALQDAKTVGANRIVFPAGTYLISELDPICISNTNTVIDLNGATLQINTNGLRKYATVKTVFGANNVRLTNGTLRGDRDEHDYTAGGEWGSGLVIESGSNLEIDHMTFTNFMGDGVVSQTGITGEGGKQRYHYVKTDNLEQGAFADDGTQIADAGKTRTIKPYDIAKANGAFEFGYTAGYMGFPYVKGRVFQACFYAADMTFIEKRAYIQYKKAPVPADAKWIHLEFNQPEVLGLGSDGSIPTIKHPYCGFISNFRSPVDVHFHDNHAIRNRRLGMAVCGGQRWIIENNLFEGNGGTAPGFGVDFEDGWLMMQDIVFRNNRFKNNDRGDLVVCGGSELLFEGNTFEKNAFFWDAALSYTFRKNRVLGGGVAFKTRTGQVTAQDNYYENCTLLIRFDPRGFNNGFFREGGVPPETPPVRLERETLVNVKSVSGTYFDFADSRLEHVSLFAGEETRLARFRNCAFKDAFISYSAKGPDVMAELINCKGALVQKGTRLATPQGDPGTVTPTDAWQRCCKGTGHSDGEPEPWR